jgi:phenylacetate-coenzyme A ligase PaaK-like adenylate-forming protein
VIWYLRSDPRGAGAWFELYGTTESGISGVHCSEHTGLHLFEDQFIVEVVDETHRLVPPGQSGDHILITSLVNSTQPLIRYVISDLVTIRPEPCPTRAAVPRSGRHRRP